MSLVIAFVGSRGAVMAGDMREILFSGNEEQVRRLEEELYRGSIVTEGELHARAAELGVELLLRDTKNKIRHHEGVLIGEVASGEKGIVNRRRLYVTTGAYCIVDLTEKGAEMRQQGSASSFVVLGSEIAKKVAGEGISRYWKGGGVKEAMEAVMRIMKEAAERTATVSRRYVMIQTGTRGEIREAMRRDGIPPDIIR